MITLTIKAGADQKYIDELITRTNWNLPQWSVHTSNTTTSTDKKRVTHRKCCLGVLQCEEQGCEFAVRVKTDKKAREKQVADPPRCDIHINTPLSYKPCTGWMRYTKVIKEGAVELIIQTGDDKTSSESFVHPHRRPPPSKVSPDVVEKIASERRAKPSTSIAKVANNILDLADPYQQPLINTQRLYYQIKKKDDLVRNFFVVYQIFLTLVVPRFFRARSMII